MRAAAYNKPNRPGTHPPRKIAPNRPSFLIHYPELETGLTCTKQTPDHISNRQFFAFLKFPDTLVPGPLRAPLASRKAVRATAKRRRAAVSEGKTPRSQNEHGAPGRTKDPTLREKRSGWGTRKGARKANAAGLGFLGGAEEDFADEALRGLGEEHGDGVGYVIGLEHFFGVL